MRTHTFSSVMISLIIVSFFPSNSIAQGITLVDFGATEAATTFGLAGWSTIQPRTYRGTPTSTSAF